MTGERDARYDVVVVGGGAAGLSGALMLARARRSVLVIDAGAPRNAPAGGVHGLLGREGMAPGELLARGRGEVAGYGGEVVDGEVTTVSGEAGRFVVALADGRAVSARRLLVATGLVDELPDVPGLRERWGHEVLHCPYCHGWEVRDRAIGVLATGPRSVHQALLFRQWSADVVYVTHTGPALDAEQAERLAARDIRVVDGEVVALEGAPGALDGLRLADGTLVRREAVVVGAPMRGRADVLAGLGLHAEQTPAGDGRVAADASGRAAVPGVWVAGNVTDLTAQVGAAAAAGALAGAAINADLIEAETDAAVAAARAPFSPRVEAHLCETVAGDRRHGLETLVSPRP